MNKFKLLTLVLSFLVWKFGPWNSSSDQIRQEITLEMDTPIPPPDFDLSPSPPLVTGRIPDSDLYQLPAGGFRIGNHPHGPVDNTDHLNFGKGDFSLSLWVKTKTLQQGMLLQKGGLSGASGPQYWLRMNDQHGHLTFLAGDGSGKSPWITHRYEVQRLDDDRWHHIIARRYGPEMTLYIDNELVAGDFREAEHVDNPQPVTLGKQLIYDEERNAFDGALAEVFVYARALDDWEIGLLFDAFNPYR